MLIVLGSNILCWYTKIDLRLSSIFLNLIIKLSESQNPSAYQQIVEQYKSQVTEILFGRRKSYD